MSLDDLLNLRGRLGMTQTQFAAYLGVSFATVNRWENGRGHPNPITLRLALLISMVEDWRAEAMSR